MKIAIFTDVLLEVPGGIGSSITAMKKSLEAAGHEVLVFAPGSRAPEEPHIIVVPTLNFFRPGGAPWARRPSLVAKWILKNYPELKSFDLFHAHYEGPTSIAAVALAHKLKKPLIQTLHGREDQALAHNIPRLAQTPVAALLDALHAKSFISQDPPQPLISDPKLAPNKRRAHMWRIITRQGNAANLVIAPSEHFAEKLQKMGLKTKITVLGNGIDDDIVPLDPQPRTWQADKPLKLLWNSRLSREKRFLPLLEALKIAGERGFKYELTAYGTGNDYKPARKYAKKHRLSVKFMGSARRPQILRTSTHSHLSVITSYDFDVHSLILVEAEACGTPLLICDPDMERSLQPGTFVLTKDPSPEAIAEALLALTPAAITAMSRKMLSHRRAIYQSSRMSALLDIYRSATQQD